MSEAFMERTMRRMLLATALIVGVVTAVPQYGFAQEATRELLAKALVKGSPWSFSNQHVNFIQTWRFSSEGKLERMTSYQPDVWVVEKFTADNTIVHPSLAGGNTVTYSLDKEGRAAAVHSKNYSVFKSLKTE